MVLIADILMAAGSLGAGIYCYVLAGRLKKFTTLETGMGGAIAVLSVQVDDMTKALQRAHAAANGSAEGLSALTLRAETVAGRLELLVAAMHDLPDGAAAGDTDFADPERKVRFIRRRSNGRNGVEAAE